MSISLSAFQPKFANDICSVPERLVKEVLEIDEDGQSKIEDVLNRKEFWAELKINGSGEIAKSGNEPSYLIGTILRKFPSASRIILNRLDDGLIYIPENVDSADLKLTLDFEQVLPTFTIESEKNEISETGLLREIVKTLGSSHERWGPLLTHPLVKAFVELKWKKYRLLALLSLLFYILLSVLMTVYVINVQLTTCRVKLNYTVMRAANYTTRDTKNNRTFVDMFRLLIHRPALEKHNKHMTTCQELSSLYFGFIPIMFLMTCIILILEILEIKTEGWSYWKTFTNLLQWVYILFGVFTMIPVNMVHWRLVLYSQYQITGFAMLVIWALLLIQVSKFPRWARYISMLGQVIKSFCEYILTFICLFIGFALCSLVLFSNLPPTETIPRAMLKTLMAMNGEFNHEEDFYRDIREVKGVNGTGLRNKHILLYPVSSHIFLVIFAIVCSMAMMNLLTALAVQDVKEMEVQAEARMLRRIIKNVCLYERITIQLRRILPKRFVSWVDKNIPMLSLRLETKQLAIFPNRDAEKNLDATTLKSIRSYIIDQRKLSCPVCHSS